MKKRILTLCVGLAAGLLLASCSGNPLPDGMDETAVLENGRQVVTDLNAGNWQSIYDQMRDDAKTITGSPEAIQNHMQTVLNEAGAYKAEEDCLATGQKLDSGEPYATAVFYCEHEEEDVVYRIAFSPEMELLGLQVAEK